MTGPVAEMDSWGVLQWVKNGTRGERKDLAVRMVEDGDRVELRLGRQKLPKRYADPIVRTRGQAGLRKLVSAVLAEVMESD